MKNNKKVKNLKKILREIRLENEKIIGRNRSKTWSEIPTAKQLRKSFKNKQYRTEE